MLAAARAFAKSWPAKILFGLLIISFGLFFGIHDVINGQVSNNAIKAGGREISAVDFKKIFEDIKSKKEQEMGGEPIDIAEFAKAGVPMQIARDMATTLSFNAWMERLGVRPAGKLVVGKIRQQPFFFNQVTGEFDQQRYEQLLGEQGLTPAKFQQQLTDDIAYQHTALGMASGLRLPKIYGALEATYALETRDAAWLVVDPALAGKPGKPTDAQLQTLLNSRKLKRPELRSASLLLFSPEPYLATVKVDEAAMQQQYNFRKDSLSQAEKRTFVQIPAPDAATATRVSQAIKAGGDPNAVAKAAKLQPIDYADKPKTAVPDAKVAAAAFSLQAGQTSDPIQGELGWAVIKVTSVTPGHEVSFAEARPEIEKELRQRLAIDKAEETVQNYQNLRDKGVPMLDAAKQVGLEVRPVPLLSKDGRLKTGQPFKAPKQVLDLMFSLAKGGESEVTELGQPGYYFAMRVDEVIPPSSPTLEELRGPLTQYWEAEEQTRLLQAKADQLAERVRKGETVQAVAASVGAKVETAQGITRDPRGGKMPPPLVGQAFGRPAGQVFSAQYADAAFAVGKVEAVHAPVPALAGARAEQVRPGMSKSYTEDLLQTAQTAARTKIKPKIYEKKIDRALGIEETAAPAKKKGA